MTIHGIDTAMGTYFYGIIRTSAADRAVRNTDRAPWGRGVGSPPAPVFASAVGDLAALVSEVDDREIGEAAGVRALRRDMVAHSDVLNRVIATTTVLPVRLGVVLPNEAVLVNEILDPQYDELLKLLERLDGAVELTVRATYREEAVLREIIADQPSLARGAGGAASYSERIELGRRIARAVQAKRARDQDWLAQQLSALAREVILRPAPSDMTVLEASLLVDRNQLKRFDAAAAHVCAQLGTLIQWDCVGPLPPYSFATIRLPVRGARMQTSAR